MGCIYHHPHIDLDEISDSYLNIPPNKLSKETEPAFLLDEFNMGLLKYVHKWISQFTFFQYDPTSNYTTNQNNFKSFIDNINSNIISPSSILGNLTATTSDHLSKCLIAPDIF